MTVATIEVHNIEKAYGEMTIARGPVIEFMDTIFGFKIKKVIFNNPATIVFWQDGTKTIVKCSKNEKFDPEKGFAMAISEKVLGSYSEFKREMAKWEDKPCK